MKITAKNIAALDAAIKAVCPIYGICSSGRIDFLPEATDTERAAARAVMDTHLSAREPSAPT